MMGLYAADASNEFKNVAPYAEHDDRTYWPCSLVRQDGVGTYTVKIWPSMWHSKPNWVKNGLPRFLTNYPQENIHIFHQPYMSDQHLSEAFRHHIGLPDDMIPLQWKNM
uniref:Uncharacterized protein n=1 Tax=Grammatophora oceanica TaxID=210454 RepID=A0A7S1YF34_9STRA